MLADPAAAERRRKEAERRARVELTGDDAGTAALSGRLLPAAQASAAWARISALAKTLQNSGAGGGIDLLRARVFIGLLLGTLPQPPDTPRPPDPGPPHPGPPDPASGTSDGPDDGDSGPAGGASSPVPAPASTSAPGDVPRPGHPAPRGHDAQPALTVPCAP